MDRYTGTNFNRPGFNALLDEILTEEKVMNPAAHQEVAYGTESRNHRYSDQCLWNSGTVIRIIERREYLGHTVLAKTVQESFKTKKRRWLPPEEWLIFPDTHEPIIDQETWDMANKQRKPAPKRVANGTFTHRLSVLIWCAAWSRNIRRRTNRSDRCGL